MSRKYDVGRRENALRGKSADAFFLHLTSYTLLSAKNPLARRNHK